MVADRLTPPAPFEVVSGEQVGHIIEATDREFVELERRAAEVRAEADEATRRAEAAGVDPNSSTWTMVRLQRFLDGLRDEAQRDAAATIEVARHRARLRVEEAREGNGRSSSAPSMTPFVVPTVPVEPFTSAWAPSPDDSALPLARDVPDPGQQAMATGAAVAGLGAVATVAREDDASALSTPQTSAAPPPIAPFVGADPAGSQASAAVPTASVVASEVHQFAPEALSGAPVDDLAPPTFEAWAPPPSVPAAVAPTVAFTEERTSEKKGKRRAPKPPKAKGHKARRIPVSAMLEVVAVLLILVFILWRLS
jgi:hypothetical protein